MEDPGRPKSIGGLLGAALRLYWGNFTGLFLLALADSVVAWALGAAGQSTAMLLLVLVLVVAGVVAQTLLVATAAAAATGVPGVRWAAMRQAWPFFVLLLVMTVVGVVGFVLVVVPGVLVLTWWAIAPVVLVRERARAFAALGRSRALVRGHFWHVLGTLVLGFVGFTAVFVGLTYLLRFHPPLAWLCRVAVSAVADPWIPCLLAVLYVDLNARAAAGGAAAHAPA